MTSLPVLTAGRMALALLVLWLAGCATPSQQAGELLRAGQGEQALELLNATLREKPGDEAARVALMRTRQTLASQVLSQIDRARSAGRAELVRPLVERLRELEPEHPRLPNLQRELERGQRHDQLVQEARGALGATGSTAPRVREAAREKLNEVLAENPGHAGALALRQRLGDTPVPAPVLPAMAAAYQKPVSLEFREAPLRSVFEALSRTAGVNFVFDKDVRGDAKVTVFLRDVTLDEAVRVVLATQALDRKLLNETTVMVFPNTQAKQREHQELVTRSLYLANAEVKQVQAMVRTIAKTRDIHIDERLNLLVVRDTPEVVRLIEQLVANVDLPEPEVMLEVEVLEVATDRKDELGLKWPETVGWGLVNADGTAPASALLGDRGSFRASVANPALLAMLRGSSGQTHILANPMIRARNREKAKVQVGQKLPIFTTTAIANVQGVSTTVTYLDLGLKLEIEPTVQLDNEVTMKIALEVTNFLGNVTGPSDSIAYEVGTRTASTSLRLKDGETQILAGLINDEDRRGAKGIPGLSGLPVLGRLFGVQTDERNRTEVVLLITPRVLRNLLPPEAAATRLAAGTEASPGTPALRLRPQARAGMAPAGTAGARSVPGVDSPAPGSAVAAAPEPGVALLLEASGEAAPGGTVAVTLRHDSAATVSGELVYDATRFLPAGGGAAEGSIAFELPARGQKAVVLRVRPDAPPGATTVQVGGVSGRGPGGEAVDVRVEGVGQVRITGTQR